jgi:hypothetical protein
MAKWTNSDGTIPPTDEEVRQDPTKGFDEDGDPISTQEELDADRREWLQRCYDKGLVMMVNAKGFDPDYKALIATLEDAGVDHGLPAVFDTGLGKHINEIFSRACGGECSSEIAAAFGVPTKTLSRYCSRHGIELQQPLTLRDLDDDIRRQASAGMSAAELAEEFAVSYTAMRNYLIANKIAYRNDRPGFIVTDSGYKLVRDPEHPLADSKGYVREHRKVVADRRLTKGTITGPQHLVVHHRNGDKLDNRPGNLEVRKHGEHTSEHAKGRTHSRRKKR